MHLFVFGEDEGINTVTYVIKDEIIQTLEQRYL